jgi:hypothetical protein
MGRSKPLLLSVVMAVSLAMVLVSISGNAGASTAKKAVLDRSTSVTRTPIGPVSPTMVGPAAAPCSGCSLLSGPARTSFGTAMAARTGASRGTRGNGRSGKPRLLPYRQPPGRLGSKRAQAATAPVIGSVNCLPVGAGCDAINNNAAGAMGVKGINAVDSASLPTNFVGDIEPPDQALCAGNGYVVEADNIGEVLIFNYGLQRLSQAVSMDGMMGLTARKWSSGGDVSCLYDGSNGGHWFFTEIASASSEASGGPFSGCFAAVANSCYEAIAVTAGKNPFGPYRVYYLNANYDPHEPGYPYLLNDYAKIATTRDSFEIFYDEFPLNGSVPGLGGGFFNGAQEFAFDKKAMERGASTMSGAAPNPSFNVAAENMGLLPTDSTGDDCLTTHGALCWYQVIPAQPSDTRQFDNSFGGSGFMLASLDFVGQGDNRVAAFDWTGLRELNNSSGCSGTSCSKIRFGGDVFSGTLPYYGEGFLAAQKAGPIPLGHECGKAGYSVIPTGSHKKKPPAHCPEGGLATNGDGMTQVAQAQHQLWGAISTEVAQNFSGESAPEIHQGALYFVIGTASFDAGNGFSLTNNQYVSAAHEDIEFPTVAAEDSPGGGAIMSFTLSGNGGPTHADRGGYYPSSAYGRLTSSSNGLSDSTINIVDMGQSPQDGFSEYQGYPNGTRPRWGDYGAAFYVPGTGIFFASEYIQYPNCKGSRFTLTIGTCGGTRDGAANWGTSVNFVAP